MGKLLVNKGLIKLQRFSFLHNVTLNATVKLLSRALSMFQIWGSSCRYQSSLFELLFNSCSSLFCTYSFLFYVICDLVFTGGTRFGVQVTSQAKGVQTQSQPHNCAPSFVPIKQPCQYDRPCHLQKTTDNAST